MPKWLLILVFYYSGFIGVLTMLKPYLVDLGYNIMQIGFMSGIVGTSVATLSALGSGLLIKKVGRNATLVILGAVNIMAALYFWNLSRMDPSLLMIYGGICLLWGAYGSSSVIIYTTSMDLARPGASGTDFTIQIVITHLSSLVIAVNSGKVADMIGYTGLFGVEAMLGVLTLIIIIFAMPKKQTT